MSKVVLVGVDGSESAERAARIAADLALAMGAELHVVTAVDPHSVSVRPATAGVRVPTPGEEAEAIARSVAGSLPSSAHIHASSVPGKPADALVRLAKEINADLIVVGNRRVQGIGRILGSVATDVAHHAPCDVYIARTV